MGVIGSENASVRASRPAGIWVWMYGGPAFPPDALASLLKTHRMKTIRAHDPSSGCPEAGRRVGGPEGGRTTSSPGPSNCTEQPQTELSHSVTEIGDIVGPVLPEEHWESRKP